MFQDELRCLTPAITKPEHGAKSSLFHDTLPIPEAQWAHVLRAGEARAPCMILYLCSSQAGNREECLITLRLVFRVSRPSRPTRLQTTLAIVACAINEDQHLAARVDRVARDRGQGQRYVEDNLPDSDRRC